MQDVSDLYLEITADQHRFECKVNIGGVDYGENVLVSMKTTRSMFSSASPAVGCCVAGEISIEMLSPSDTIPRMAEIKPYVRAVNDTKQSEWIQKGDYFIDTRETSENDIITLHGYDAMLKAEVGFPIAYIVDYPTTDILAVQAIASQIGVPLDERTLDIMVNGYAVQMPSGYTSRETLGYIGAMYAGCWIINDLGKLQLVALNGLPEETNYLTDDNGNLIVFGSTRILI